MTLNANRIIHRLLLPSLAALLLLHGCAAPDKPAAPTAISAVASDDASRRLANGDYAGAARVFLQQAETAKPPQRETLQLSAAEALLRGKQAEQAAGILEKLPLTGGADYTTRLAIAQARLFLQRQQPQAALQRLARVSDSVAPEQMLDFHRARVDAYAAAGNHLENARERVWLDGLLDASAQAANHQNIWDALSKLSDAVLANMRTAAPPDVFSGWLELVETSRALRDTPEQLDIALAIWRERYPGHPAIPDFLNALQGRDANVAQPGLQVAVLLPLSGNLAEAGIAVRDGMITAQLQKADAQRLRFYDTGSETDRIWATYQRAVSEGAQHVIGPLSKEAVATLAAAGPLSIPVLALNNLPDDAQVPALLYQYGLAPEDEAEQIAQRAWLDGHRRALMLVPEGILGQRLHQAFAEHWRALGGTLLDARAYGSDQNSYSEIIRGLLKLDASERRLQDLTRLLGQKPVLVPRPRQDADFVFLASQPDQARLLRPLFSYHHAAQLPIYATSQVYDGNSTPQRDRDLNGLRLCDMPWMLPTGHPGAALRGEITRLWPGRAHRYPRLYALGIDALHLLPQLQGLQNGSFARYPGVTGDLYLDKDRRVHRDLQWAQFQDGRLVALPDSAAIASTPTQDITDETPDQQNPAGSTR